MLEKADHQYAMTGQLSSKSDVYSFGVVLLELLTGCKPVDHTLLTNVGIWGYAHQDAHEFLNFLLNELVDIMEKEHQAAKDPLVTWVHENFQGSWLDLLSSWGAITDSYHYSMALLTAQTFAYHVWRERNARAHNKGSFGPRKLSMGIVLDVATRCESSTWFCTSTCVDTFRSLFRL